MKIHLQYGKGGLDIDIPASNVTILEPQFIKGLQNESDKFKAAVRDPIGSKPLKDLINAKDKVAVVIPDITRPLPSDRLLPWLFEELAHVPVGNFTIIIGTGSHRINTDDEIVAMVGANVASKYRVVNHNSHDPDTMELAGKTTAGHPVLMNKEYVHADKRIALGFIEPHFMAGFSGGYKAVMPGIVDIDSIMRYHSASVIGDPRSTWGLLENNPTQEIIRADGALLPVTFYINVTVNKNRQITRFFCGDVLAAHEEGCKFAKATAMVACPQAFPIVITTNGGYPLDQNLYQTVKGMSAAAQIVKEGGLIVTASKCNDGFPSHGNFRKLLFDHRSPNELLDTILAPGFSMYDQWEAQLLAIILIKARGALYSDLTPEETQRAHLEPIDDINAFIAKEINALGKDESIAVLPEGPMTIPYLEN